MGQPPGVVGQFERSDGRAGVSVTILWIIPTDPGWKPCDRAARAALKVLAEFTPSARDHDLVYPDDMAFFDPGENFERVDCPLCGTMIDMGWWTQEMSFEDRAVTTPCCHKQTTLNDLVYVWPAGFARFALTCHDPEREALAPDEEQRLQDALGHPIRQIWSRY
jgi:hypothetical protein